MHNNIMLLLQRVQVAYSLENRGEKEEEDRRIKELGELLAEMQ
jgi:hypothetical protein